MGHASLDNQMKLALQKSTKSDSNWLPFLVMQISGKKCSIFRYENHAFSKIGNGPESISEVVNDAPEKVSNFSDQAARKQVLLDKFLHHIDHCLSDILRSNPLPLYVLGTKRVFGHFRKISKNTSSIVGYIHGNYDDLKPVQLLRIMRQYEPPIKRIS